MRRRFALSILAVLIALVPARSQDYPARPIRLLVTSPAGSLVDVLSRLLTQDLSTRLGQSIIVDNRPGGMTQVAMDALVRAPADGYTLMLGTNEMALLPFLKKSYRYDPRKDFTPVALVTTSWTVFAVNPKVPAQTLPELVMLPDVPTTAELGLPDVRMDTWFGVIAPANTPQPVVDRLAQAIDAVVHEPSFRDKLSALGCAVAWMPPAEFVAYITDETRKWSQLIPAMGISIEE